MGCGIGRDRSGDNDLRVDEIEEKRGEQTSQQQQQHNSKQHQNKRKSVTDENAVQTIHNQRYAATGNEGDDTTTDMHNDSTPGDELALTNNKRKKKKKKRGDDDDDDEDGDGATTDIKPKDSDIERLLLAYKDKPDKTHTGQTSTLYTNKHALTMRRVEQEKEKKEQEEREERRRKAKLEEEREEEEDQPGQRQKQQQQLDIPDDDDVPSPEMSPLRTNNWNIDSLPPTNSRQMNDRIEGNSDVIALSQPLPFTLSHKKQQQLDSTTTDVISPSTKKSPPLRALNIHAQVTTQSSAITPHSRQSTLASPANENGNGADRQQTLSRFATSHHHSAFRQESMPGMIALTDDTNEKDDDSEQQEKQQQQQFQSQKKIASLTFNSERDSSLQPSRANTQTQNGSSFKPHFQQNAVMSLRQQQDEGDDEFSY